ncbi:hypothetical protein [Streptomyces sp. NPDC002057]|uniref:hypothetical protein n=1 Tax=Streptomyces sp. NPDC002057 TaxID=3154664 RepID=UPI00332E97C2
MTVQDRALSSSDLVLHDLFAAQTDVRVTSCFDKGGTYRWHVMFETAQESVEEQVRRFVEQITATDPRESAKSR